MTDGEIDAAIARPLAQRRRAADQVSSFARDRASTVSANNMRGHPGFGSQLDRLRKVTGRNLNLMSARDKLRNQRAKERHVRRVSQVDPDSHGLRNRER